MIDKKLISKYWEDTREQFENKMVDLIEDNNCHIENFYFQHEDDELTYERRV